MKQRIKETKRPRNKETKNQRKQRNHRDPREQREEQSQRKQRNRQNNESNGNNKKQTANRRMCEASLIERIPLSTHTRTDANAINRATVGAEMRRRPASNTSPKRGGNSSRQRGILPFRWKHHENFDGASSVGPSLTTQTSAIAMLHAREGHNRSNDTEI